jgi:hypothetical protein
MKPVNFPKQILPHIFTDQLHPNNPTEQMSNFYLMLEAGPAYEMLLTFTKTR